ncbi:MAG TPA: hypothetical protein VGL38_12875 [bacterium]|jgi:hypothetical protein
MKSLKALLIVAIGLSTWLAGCKVKNPGSAMGNNPPTTTLSVAPRDSAVVNYFITLAWSGNDPDGNVAFYRLYVDSVQIGTTTARDTTLAFFSPQDSTPTLHSFSVQAVDDQGLADPNPPLRRFFTLNRAPTTTFGSVGIANHDTLGTNFRVSVRSNSPRPSSTQYSVSVDNQTDWSAWTADSIFAFASPDLLTDPFFPPGVFGISNASLAPNQQHIIYIRSQNAGGAVSNVAADTVYVGSGPAFQPVMDPTLSATYGGNAFYPDGSEYYVQATGQTVSIGFVAHAPYKGEINAYRYRTGQFTGGDVSWNNWSNWQTRTTIDTTDLLPGDYPFQFMARDLSNDFTDTLTYVVHLVQQVLSDSVIIAADTRNGNGTQGQPTQNQVNTFYASILDAGNVTKHRVVQVTVDAANPDLSRQNRTYLSPYDVRNAGLVLWHMDDPGTADTTVGNARQRILNDYTAKGGRIILSGWNILAKFQEDPGDTVAFSAASYATTRLKIFSGWRTGSRPNVVGMDGANGFPGVRFDSTKVSSRLAGKLPNCWTFDVQGQDIVTGLMAVSDSTSNPRYHRPSAYIYNLSFRIAVYGVPLYFCFDSDVQNLFYNPNDPTHSVLTIMTQGLQPAM